VFRVTEIKYFQKHGCFFSAQAGGWKLDAWAAAFAFGKRLVQPTPILGAHKPSGVPSPLGLCVL
jgi:hypothetical protein